MFLFCQHCHRAKAQLQLSNKYIYIYHNRAVKLETTGIGIWSVERRQRVFCEVGTEFLDTSSNGHSHMGVATSNAKPSSGASIGFSPNCLQLSRTGRYVTYICAYRLKSHMPRPGFEPGPPRWKARD
jgi:hypothetical protein